MTDDESDDNEKYKLRRIKEIVFIRLDILTWTFDSLAFKPYRCCCVGLRYSPSGP